MLAAQDAAEGLTDEDAVPELPETPVSRAGDLWILGNHKLLVGDATTAPMSTRLMAGDAADLVFTDPPYNVDYEGYTEDRLKIKGDRMSADEFKQFLEAAFRSYRTVVKPGASLYVCHSSSWQREFQNALEAAGFEVRCQIIWAKNTFAWGFGRYKFQHEPIFYCHVAGQKDPWYGDKSQSTLWQEKKPAANRIHPTAKPVELVERALLNSSKAGDIVADLFGGSGSTLIACERREPQGAADGDRSEVRRLHRSALSGVHGQAGRARRRRADVRGDRRGARREHGMNRPLPPGDRGDRSAAAGRPSGRRGTVSGAGGLVGGTEATACRADKKSRRGGTPAAHASPVGGDQPLTE